MSSLHFNRNSIQLNSLRFVQAETNFFICDALTTSLQIRRLFNTTRHTSTNLILLQSKGPRQDSKRLLRAEGSDVFLVMLCYYVIARGLLLVKLYTGKVRNQPPVCTMGTATVLSRVYVHLTAGAQGVVVITTNKMQRQAHYACKNLEKIRNGQPFQHISTSISTISNSKQNPKEKWLQSITTCRPSQQ